MDYPAILTTHGVPKYPGVVGGVRFANDIYIHLTWLCCRRMTDKSGGGTYTDGMRSIISSLAEDCLRLF